MSALVPVLRSDMSVADWKRTLNKMTAGAAAETVVAIIYEPFCDYGYSVTVLRRVLQAWAEINHGLGADSSRSLVPSA
jgi:hypothetical protein